MSKAIVDKEKCIGCGACVAIDPETFDFDEEGLSMVKSETTNENTVNAVESCPVDAIKIEE